MGESTRADNVILIVQKYKLKRNLQDEIKLIVSMYHYLRLLVPNIEAWRVLQVPRQRIRRE